LGKRICFLSGKELRTSASRVLQKGEKEVQETRKRDYLGVGREPVPPNKKKRDLTIPRKKATLVQGNREVGEESLILGALVKGKRISYREKDLFGGGKRNTISIRRRIELGHQKKKF